MSLPELKQISTYSIWSKLDEGTVDLVFDFSLKYNLKELSLACSRLKLKYIEFEIDSFDNAHMEIAYMQNKFQIKQKMMIKQNSLTLNKKISSISTEGEKENYETYN